ncbi:MAG: LEPR-XLL domain-containing protein, partial [Burkholderiaceae bacterium]
MKRRSKSALARLVRDAFRVEPLEPRVLLSADPVAAVVPAIVMDDRDRQAAAPGFHSFDSVPSDGTASLISLEPLAAPT